MKIPTLQGTIKRRILVNYCAAPDVIQQILPKGFRPKLYKGKAIAGICLIRLEHIRPKFAPEFIGLSSENAAHRIAVEWEDGGEIKEGVYVPRRDTDSFVNSAVGGRLFPGEHHKAKFEVEENEVEIDFKMKSDDGEVSVNFAGKLSDNLPKNSVFSSLTEASNFFEKGSLGYSATQNASELDGILLQIENWKVVPIELDFVHTSFYEDESISPKNSIKFDHALFMQNVAHEWHSAKSFELKEIPV
jgi:hypothetical protein